MRSHPRTRPLAAAVALALMVAPAAATARAQQSPPSSGASAQPATPPPPVAVGDMAPDFSLPGATRYGLLREPVRLSSFRGQTVVLAFFYKARTKG
ncbi:MAG TPA: hypothetical protein VKA84_21685 [Gemmatimonadaceae bacterium]|nr:hypothetical protein [Gemmatimonadaceae bacterium]